MLATMLVMPGGLVLLTSIALLILLARTARGRRLLAVAQRRVPPRLRAYVKRALVMARAEDLFLGGPRSLHSA